MSSDDKPNLHVKSFCGFAPLRHGTIIVSAINLAIHIIMLAESKIILYKRNEPLSVVDYAILITFGLVSITTDICIMLAAILKNGKLYRIACNWVFSNLSCPLYLVLIVLFCVRAWGNENATTDIAIALFLYFAYCYVINVYFYIVARSYYQEMTAGEVKVVERTGTINVVQTA